MRECVYTVKEFAEILKISLKTAYTLIHDGELNYIKVRGQIRIPSSAIKEYLEGGWINEGRNTRELVPER